MRRGRLFLAFAVAFFACVVTWRAEAGFGPAQGSSGGLGGVVLTGTPSAGKVPTATSTTTATWQTPSGGINPTTSIITLGDGLGTVIQVNGPTDAVFRLRPGGTQNLLIDGGSSGASLALNNNGLVQLANNNRVVLQADAGDGLSLRDGAGVAAVWSGTLETRLGGTIAQPTQVSQAATKTLDTTAAYWNANSSGAQTFTLPDATACAGRVYAIKNVNTGTLTIATTSSQKIDGGTSLTVSTQYQSYTLVSDGVQWWIY